MLDLIVLLGGDNQSNVIGATLYPNMPIEYSNSSYNFITEVIQNTISNFNIVDFSNVINLDIFVEGSPVNKDRLLNIEVISSNSTFNYGFYAYYNKLNLNLNKNAYKITSGNWYTVIKESMVAGYIGGVVNLSDCADLDLYIKCFRHDDNLFIGEYELNGNTYNIPNLDCNTRYNVIMIDRNRVVEQKVLSYRLPEPY